jgi:glucose/arabinose dehydrogenase
MYHVFPAGTMKRFAHSFPAFALAITISASACCEDGSGGGGTNGSNGQAEPNAFGVTSEFFAPANNPDAIQFAPDGRLFIADHWSGTIRVAGSDGSVPADPWATVPNVTANLFWGLTGLAIDPEFETNRYVYAFYTELVEAGPPAVGKPVVVRFTEQDGKGTDLQVIVGDLPAAGPFNVMGSINFGPDGFLYVTLGDYGNPEQAGATGQPLPQDLGSPIGKVLRISKADGSAPADNPFVGQSGADPRIFAYGFREAFDFAFHPTNGAMYGTDNGGRTCGEVNIIVKGADYGWPRTAQSPFDCAVTPQTAPIYLLAKDGARPNDIDSTLAVGGVELISASVYPNLGDSLIICEIDTLMRRLVLAPPNFDSVTANDVIQQNGCFAIAASQDGIIYYGTTYEIRRLLPPAETPSTPPATSEN